MIADTEFEIRITRALARDAQRAPEPAFPGRWATPPCRRRIRTRRLALRIALVAAVATVAASTGILLVARGQVAYASWRSTPEQASPATTTAITRACQRDAGQLTITLANGQDVTPNFDHPLAVDVRGHDAYAIALDGNQVVDCMTTVPGMSNDGLPAGVDGRVNPTDLRGTSVTTMPTAGKPLTLLSVKAPAGNMISRYDVTWVAGRIAPNVTRVVITTPTGSIVPTINNGVFAAWWPGNNADQTTITTYDSSGTPLASADQLTCASPRMHFTGQPTTGGCQR